MIEGNVGHHAFPQRTCMIRCQSRGISSHGLAVEWVSDGKACCMHTLRHEARIGAR